MIKQGKAKKKPVTIDWFEWDNNIDSLKNWVNRFNDDINDEFEIISYRCINCPHKIKVKTLEGSSYEVPRGYIIIRGIKGEYYPCEPKIFDLTYKRV